MDLQTKLLKTAEPKIKDVATIYKVNSKDVSILAIPKNCSSSIITGLKPSVIGSANTVICILRDPFDRWRSGTIQYFTHEERLQAHTLDVWLKTGTYFDEHTLPQTTFIKGNNIVYYYYKSNVLESIQADWNIFDSIPHLQKTEQPDKQKIKRKVDKWISKNKEQLKDKIVNIYKDDYEQIEKVKFKNE